MEFDPQKIAASPLTAGLAGAVIASFKFLPGASWAERVANVLAGGVIAYFVAPAAWEGFKLTSVAMLGFMAFMLGMFGMSLAAAGVQAIKDTKFAEALSSWITKK